MIKSNKINTFARMYTGQKSIYGLDIRDWIREIQANNNDTSGVGISSDFAVGITGDCFPAPRTITSV